MTTKILLLNGPPGSGKDTISNSLSNLLDNYTIKQRKFAKYVKDATHRLYDAGDVSHDHFENSKEIPDLLFYGLTPRQSYINIAEKLLKPVHGDDIFAKMLVNSMNNDQPIDNELIIISDSGFVEEIAPLINRYGVENIYLVRIHRDNTSYSNDSRNYVYFDAIYSIDVDNNYTVEDVCTKIIQDLGL